MEHSRHIQLLVIGVDSQKKVIDLLWRYLTGKYISKVPYKAFERHFYNNSHEVTKLLWKGSHAEIKALFYFLINTIKIINSKTPNKLIQDHFLFHLNPSLPYPTPSLRSITSESYYQELINYEEYPKLDSQLIKLFKEIQELSEAIPLFPNLDEYTSKKIFINYQKEIFTCKKCNCNLFYWFPNIEQFKCKRCSNKTSLRSGTILGNSKLPFRYWINAVLVSKYKISIVGFNNIIGGSSYQYKPIFNMIKKIRNPSVENSKFRIDINNSYKKIVLTST